MTKIKLKRPAPGTILGFLALMVALAGNANALGSHTIIRKGDIAKGAVTASALAKGAVHSKALASGAVNAKALAAGAVTSKALASGAVTASVLAPGAVGAPAIAPAAVHSAALAPDAVTASALAPNSVYGGALGPVTVHSTPIADLDESADLSNWTSSNTEIAACGPGERLLTGGVVFTNPGNRRVGIIESLPFSNTSLSGMSGQITSDSGGTAAAEVQALCLK